MEKLDENIFKALTKNFIINGILTNFGENMPKTFSSKPKISHLITNLKTLVIVFKFEPSYL